MRIFIIVLFLILNLQSWTKADDIREFEIEGMSIGDSLLEHFNKSEIDKMVKDFYPNSDEYYLLNYNDVSKFELFTSAAFHIKKDDQNFIIHSIKGGIYYPNELDKCKDKKDEVNDYLKSLFVNVEPYEYDYNYTVDDGKSIAYITDFEFANNDSIRIFCVNWSKITEEKRNFVDNLALSISTGYFLDWVTNKANP